VKGEIVAALAASLYRRSRLAGEAAGLGDTGFLQLDAEDGRLCAAGYGELVIVAVAESRANAGLIRAEMLRPVEAPQ
jgi:predicted regulator of Ras-like GTPase activity (Roadblock/LC7/MglB family)